MVGGGGREEWGAIGRNVYLTYQDLAEFGSIDSVSESLAVLPFWELWGRNSNGWAYLLPARHGPNVVLKLH